MHRNETNKPLPNSGARLTGDETRGDKEVSTHDESRIELRRTSQTPTGSAPPPPKKTAFVQKLYSMLCDPKLSHLIWWSRGEKDGVFALHPCTEFATALTTYFKHGNVSSFVRQLHMYGFHKVFDTYNEEHSSADRGSDDLVWEFRHSTGAFRKGDEESLSLIKRRSSNRVVPDEQLRLTEYPQTMSTIHPPQQMPLPPHPQQSQAHYYYPMPHLVPTAMIHYNIAQGSEYGHAIPMQQGHPNQIQQVVYVQQQHPPQPHTPQLQQKEEETVSNHSTPTSQHRSLPSQPQQQIRPPSRQMSLAVAPEQQAVIAATQDIAAQQQNINARADTVAELQRATTGDVLKIGDQLPKIAPTLQKSGQKYAESLGQLQQRFHSRAESCTPEPQPEPQQQLQQQQLQQLHHQQQKQQPQQMHSPHQHSQSHPGTVMMNPFAQGISQRNQSIHFWERSSARQPSVFVDPLNPVPHHSPQMGSVPSSPSHSTTSSQRSSTVSLSAVPTHFQHQHPLAHQQAMHQQQQQHYHQQQQRQQNRNATSVPHLYSPGSPATQGLQRRTDSLPTHFPVPPSAHQQMPQRQLAPRSIPEDHPQQHYAHPHMQSPQQPQVRSGSSTPNMNQMNTRLRPSLLEFYNNNPVHQQSQQQTTSLSSNSTYSSTLYSTQSSISSVSTRNSQGSFSGIAHDAFAARQGLESTISPPIVGKDSRQSVITVLEERTSTPSVSKVAVSSLLSSPGTFEGTKKRSSTDEGQGEDTKRGLKKVKSISNLK